MLATGRTLALCVAALMPFAAPRVMPAQGTAKVVSSEIAISRERAEIKLELESGQKVTLATVADAPRRLQRSGVPGDELVTLGVTRGDAVDRAWRELLNRAMEAQSGQLAGMLRDWNAPGPAGPGLGPGRGRRPHGSSHGAGRSGPAGGAGHGRQPDAAAEQDRASGGAAR